MIEYLIHIDLQVIVSNQMKIRYAFYKNIGGVTVSARDIVFRFELEQIQNMLIYYNKVLGVFEKEKGFIDKKYAMLKDETREDWDFIYADYEDEYYVFELFITNLKYSVITTTWTFFEKKLQELYKIIAKFEGESEKTIDRNSKNISLLLNGIFNISEGEDIVDKELQNKLIEYKEVRNRILHSQGEVIEKDVLDGKYGDVKYNHYHIDFDEDYIKNYIDVICETLGAVYSYQKRMFSKEKSTVK